MPTNAQKLTWKPWYLPLWAFFVVMLAFAGGPATRCVAAPHVRRHGSQATARSCALPVAVLRAAAHPLFPPDFPTDFSTGSAAVKHHRLRGPSLDSSPLFRRLHPHVLRLVCASVPLSLFTPPAYTNPLDCAGPRAPPV